MNINEAIMVAFTECKDEYAKSYLAVARQMVKIPQQDEEALKVQILYCLSNMSHWRGPTARQVKLAFREYVK